MAIRDEQTERRLARLEALFVALFLSETDLGEEPELRHLLRRLFRGPGDKGLPFPHWPELEELLFHRPPYRLRREVDTLREDVGRLRSLASEAASSIEQASRSAQDIPTLKQDLYGFVMLQSLGVDLGDFSFHRPLPLRLYLKIDNEPEREQLSGALQKFAEALGFEPAAEFPAESGSWFKRWFARSKETLTQPEVVARLEMAERAIAVAALHTPQAVADNQQAIAASSLITALKNTPNAALQIGSLLLVKMTDASGAKVVARTLSQAELIYLEKNQHLLHQPECILKILTQAGEEPQSVSPKADPPKRA